MPIVAATGISSGTLKPDKSLSKKIEQAMTQAVVDCNAEGITDVDIIRSRIQEARKKVASG